MNQPSRPVTWRRVLGVSLFAICAMALAGFAWAKASGSLKDENPLLFGLGLIFAVWAAMWLTGGRLIRDINRHTEWRKQSGSK
jgi:hypothetical protein